jgi:hypothetical protein
MSRPAELELARTPADRRVFALAGVAVAAFVVRGLANDAAAASVLSSG